MLKKGIFFSILTLILIPSWSITKIEGIAIDMPNKQVELIQYKDYFIKNYKILTSIKSDDNGYFNLEYKQQVSTIECFIRINDKICKIYLDKDSTYNVRISPESTTKKFRGNKVDIGFVGLSGFDINSLIIDFENEEANFVNQYLFKVGDPKQKEEALNKFKKRISIRYEDVNHPFFKNHVKYIIGQYDLSGKTDLSPIKRQVINSIYFEDKPILYQSSAYHHLLDETFKNYLKSRRVKNYQNIQKHLENPCYKCILNDLDSIYLYKGQEQLKDYTLVKFLSSVYYDEITTPDNVIQLLDSVIIKSKYQTHKEYAQNAKSYFTSTEKGRDAIQFTLINQNNDSISPSLYQKKYIYINFFSSNSHTSKTEMDIIPSYITNYGKYVKFISICVDNDKKQYEAFMKNNPQYNWDILFLDGDNKLINDYRVKSIPHYVLLAPENKIEQFEAYSPSPNGAFISIDNTFFDIKKRLKPKKEWNVGQK